MNPKINDLITIFLIQLVITLPFYTANVYGLTISNVRVAKVTSNSATIEWSTDNASDGKVLYGKTTALGFKQRHDNFIANHTINVFGLDSDTAYFFAVESIDLTGNTAIDNNSNNFYAFRTTDINPPPQVTGLKAVSTTSNSVFLSWDNLSIADLSHYLVYRDRILIANTTTNSFNDTGLSSDTDFSYKVSAVDNSGNEGPQSDTFIAKTSAIDSKAPFIGNVDVLPITDTTARVAWLTDENATTTVLYGINKTDKTKSSSDLVINHTIVIDGLTKNFVFAFTVKSCDSSNNCANFSGSFTAGRDITPPFINLSIPRFVNRRVIDLIGSTEPFSSVALFINDMNLPKRSLGSSEIGSSGKFVFSQVQLEKDNVIKIVIVDKSGNKNQKIFELSIDTEDPIVQLNEVPSLTSKLNLTISGSVNEQVLIKVFVDAKVNESAVPSKITGLNATASQNFVKLIWHESKDKDFSHYVVYRADASPIAITKPANFNLFIDALVDSGRSYTYQVSAVNNLGREGPKSEPMTVTIPKGGAILNLKYHEVDIFEDFRKPVLVLNGSGSFNFGVRLDKGDGNYFIKLIFEDGAENSVIFDKSITLDTKKPDVKIISPPSGAFIFENVANEIDVIGNTKPNARVHLFVDRTPFSFFNKSLELSGLPNEIQNIPEAELDAKCRFNVAATSFCSTGADFSVSADEQGNFKFENVDFTAIFGGAARIREVPVTEFRDIRLEEGKEAKTTTLVVIATDATGQRGVATQNVRIGTCWSGNQSWDIVPLTEHQSPVFISTERLAEGTETLNFYFKYSYIGRGTNAKITDVALSKACSAREIIDPRFNISCQIMPSGGSAKLSSDKVYSYSSVTLSRFPGMDRFLESDWKNFFKAINKELTFPFKVRIRYEHEVIDENGQSSKVTETQTTCEQVSYAVDNSIIDPRKVLPDWLIFDFVDFLQSSIKSLTQLQEQMDKLIDFVAVGCLFSFGAHLVTRIYRIWVEFADESLFKLKAGEILQFKLDTSIKSDNCKAIAEAVQEGYGLSGIRSLKLKYFSDADLKECFPASDAAWKTEANMYQLQRWSCDRIFGHAAPSRWTETESDDELHRQITSAKTCASDLDTKGQRLRVENCKDVAEKFIDIIQAKKDIPQDKKCFLVNLDPKNTQKQFIYTFADDQDAALTSNKIYKLTSFERNFIPGKRDIYAIKISENLYMTHQPQTCEQLCGIQPDAKQSQISVGGQPYIFAEGKSTVLKKVEDKQTGGKPTQTTIAGCVTVNQCREWNAKADSKAEGIIIPGLGLENNVLKGYTVQRKGYTNECFFDGNPNNINVISATDPNLRKECCCVNGKSSPFKELYYQPKEADTKLSSQFQKPVHQSKSKLGEPPEDYADMEWSYRYSKIGYLSKKYNPNRYIEGRDKPACFGQNNLFYQLFGKEREVLVVDPFKQDTAALIPCVFLTGVNQRLQLIKNIMSAMSTCLIQVRSTGRADTGVCKELFTQHLCGLIWQGVRWFVDGCTPEDLAFEAGDREERFIDTLRVGVKGITQGISEMQQEISEEYSNAKLNDLLGAGEENVARKVCLAAFGYDWEINARNLVDAAYSAPFATLVQAITRSREFLTVDPVSLRSKHEYRASWLINPGCDLERYDIQLACVSRKELDEYPNQISCGSVGAPSIFYTGGLGTSTAYSQCDCLDLPQEQTTPFFSESRLKQNSLVDKNNRKIVESDRRYDHLKFILRTDRRIPANAKSNCFPTGYEKGVFYFPLIDKTPRDIADCKVDITLGLFTCTGGVEFFNRKGIAELIEVTINGENADKVKELSIGDPLRVGAKVRKTGKDKCIRVSVPTDPIEPKYDGITQNWTSDIAPITITDSLRVAGRAGQVIARGITFSLIVSNNQEPVIINIRALDENKNKVYGKGDKVFIDGQEISLDSDGEYNGGKIKVIDKTITIEKESAKIEIRNIQYSQVQPGSYEYQDTITINPYQQTTQDTQRKTILVELFHLKEDKDSYDNNPDNCNLNDKITERKYTITVSQQKGVDASTLAPFIQIIKPASNAKIVGGKVVEVLSRITHKTGIKKAELVIKDSSGKEIFRTMELPRDGDNFYHNLDTSGLEGGKYFGNIKAESRAETKSDKSFQFELIEQK